MRDQANMVETTSKSIHVNFDHVCVDIYYCMCILTRVSMGLGPNVFHLHVKIKKYKWQPTPRANNWK